MDNNFYYTALEWDERLLDSVKIAMKEVEDGKGQLDSRHESKERCSEKNAKGERRRENT